MLRKRIRTFESLEARQLLAADVSLKGDVLTIRGTNHDDVINVERPDSGPNAGMLQVTVNGQQELFNYDYNGTGTGSISQVFIRGRRGNDQITISDNVYFHSIVTGGRGNDVIQSGSGDDTIDAGRGNDKIYGNGGDDLVTAGRGNDTFQGGGGSDTCSGGRGNDSLDGGDGKDTLTGDAGNDDIEGGKAQDVCFGGAGDDQILGGSQDDLIDGGDGNDQLFGESGADVVFGQLGDDRLDGGDSNDFLDGGVGNDNVLGGAGNDELKGGVGIDSLDGQEGNNLLDNEAETETLLNGIVVDLDREFLLNFATGGPNSFAKFDLQNVNGQVVEKLTVQTHGLLGQPDFNLLVDGQTEVTIPVDGNGDASVVYSSDPIGNELPFPLGAPPIGSNSSVSGSGTLAGTVVQKYVI